MKNMMTANNTTHNMYNPYFIILPPFFTGIKPMNKHEILDTVEQLLQLFNKRVCMGTNI
jgi:hypothetical protein